MSNDSRHLIDLLQSHAKQYRNHPAFTFLTNGEIEAECITYAELDVRARALAVHLKQFAKAYDRAMILLPNSIDYVIAFFGCIYAGIIAVPTYTPHLNNRFFQRIQPIMVDSGANLIITQQKIIQDLQTHPQYKQTFNDLHWVSMDSLTFDISHDWRAPIVKADDIAYLQYTSGSTSLPKGVMVTHDNLLTNISQTYHIWQRDENSTIVSWLPLFHDFGLIGMVLQNIFSGSHCVLFSPAAFVQKPLRWLQAISRYQAHTTAAPNFAYDLCVEKITAAQKTELNLSSLKVASNGAEPVRVKTLQRFAETFAPCGFNPTAFFPSYGMAESTLVISSGYQNENHLHRHFDKASLAQDRVLLVNNQAAALTQTIASCGQSLPDQDLLIVNPHTKMPCEENCIGEIWVRSKSVAKGYWGRPKETAETFNAWLADKTSGPYLRTGDLGFIFQNELLVTGRLKDILIIKGRNHYPQDIEYTVEQAHPALDPNNGAAFAIDIDGIERLVIVYCVRRTALSQLNATAVFQAIRQAVTQTHDVELYDIVLLKPTASLKTTSGKIQRRACKQAYLDNHLESVAQLRQPITHKKNAAEIQDWLTAALVNLCQVNRNEIQFDTTFDQYGLDSIKNIELSGALAEWIGIDLPATLLYDYPTLQKLSLHVANLLEQQVATTPSAARHSNATLSPQTVTPEPIAIIGMACRFPKASSLDEFWALLVRGETAIDDVPEDRSWPQAHLTISATDKKAINQGGFITQLAAFDPQFFGISPREAICMDPQQRLLLMTSYEAIEDAGIALQDLKESKTGVFIGISSHEYAQLLQQNDADIYASVGGASSIAANRLSYFYDLHGPSLAIDTACSSSLMAIHLACQSLRRGESQMAIVGGANVLLSPATSLQFTKMNFLSPDGRCKAFDNQANGYVRSEGIGVVILKPLSQAEKAGDKIYGVLLGSATNQDGRTNGLTAPNQFSQQAVLSAAYEDAQISPSIVQYIEAHGTGTPLGDPIEINALNAVIGHRRSTHTVCRIGSVKANIGHLEPAAGIASLIKVVLMLKYKQIPPQIHFHQPNPHIPFSTMPFKIETQLVPWQKQLTQERIAGVSAFGFGGTNVHVVLREYTSTKPPTISSVSTQPLLFVLSAKTVLALKQLAKHCAEHFENGGQISLYDICYTTAFYRQHFEKRLAIIVDSVSALVAQLHQLSRTATEHFDAHLFMLNTTTDTPLETYAHQYLSGETIPWKSIFTKLGQRVDFPHYPWQLEKYWLKIKTSDTLPTSANENSKTHRELQILVDLKLIIADLMQIAPDKIDPAVPLLEMGADSIILLSVIEKIDTQFQVKIAVHEFFEELKTLTAIANYIGSTTLSDRPIPAAAPACALPTKDPLGFIGRHHIKPSLLGTQKTTAPRPAALKNNKIDFSLYYFGRYPAEFSADKYMLLFESAKLADTHQFKSLWLPERHFHEFGGFSPNPSVLCAALARETQQIQLRAGSVVSPLHHAIRIAEEWALVDNLSQGRVGIAFASGWQPDDFVLAPDAFGQHRELLFQQIQTIQQLWRGETIQAKNGLGQETAVKLFPLPKQSYLPSWITVVNNPQTYQKAGEMGLGILTNLMGQTVDDLTRNITLYHEALQQAGHGLDRSHVVVLVHTFMGSDLATTLTQARDPFCRYLQSSLSLFKNIAKTNGFNIDSEKLSPQDLNYLLNKVYERYTQNSALIGTPKTTAPIVDALRAAGVDEIGCFIDFGIAPQQVLENFQHLVLLKNQFTYSSTHTSEPIKTTYPVSDNQKQLLLISEMSDHAAGSCAYHVSIHLGLKGNLNLSLFKKAFENVIARHSALRISFDDHFQAKMLVGNHTLPFYYTENMTENNVSTWVEQQINKPFNLKQDQLIRAHLLKHKENEYVLLLMAHHIIVDGWSAGVILEELMAHYSAYEKNSPFIEKSAPMQFDDYLAQLQLDKWQNIREKNAAYWIKKFTNPSPPLQLPYDYPAVTQRIHPASSEMIQLNPNTVQKLKTLSHANQVTLFMTLFAAYQVFLFQLTGQSEITVVTPTHGRYIDGSQSLVGFCSYIMPIHAVVNGNENFSTFLHQFRDVLLAAYQHQIYALPTVLDALKLPTNQFPFSSVVFNLDSGLHLQSLDGIQVTWHRPPITHIDYELMFNLFEVDHHYWVACNYSRDLFKPETIQTWLKYYQQLLDVVTTDQYKLINEMSLMSPIEQRQLISQSQSIETHHIPDASMVAAFKYQVQVNPKQIAIVDNDRQITYQRLDEQSNKLAHALNQQLANSANIIAFYADASIEAIIAILAILKAGHAYLSITTDLPEERIRHILKESQTPILITTQTWREKIAKMAPARLSIICIEDTENEDASFPEVPITPDFLACILYTSGTTGLPKGVMIEHQGILRLVKSHKPIPFTREAQVGQTANLCFDASLLEIWGALLNGGTLHLIPKVTLLDTIAMEKYLQSHAITHLFLTTALFHRYAQYAPQTLQYLKYLLFGGEAVQASAINQLQRYYQYQLPFQLINGYGPTENTTCSTCYIIGNTPYHHLIPIGTPWSQSIALVLDKHFQLTPPTVVGELFVGGEGLARGYYQNPALTQEKFIDINLAGKIQRLYRTGDFARWRTDGQLEFLGRIDKQIKIRGHRVEISEIEAKINAYAGVLQAAVTTQAAPTGLQLVAYYIRKSSYEFSKQQLQSYLKKHLPIYLMPTHLYEVDELPLTLTGKINYQALKPVNAKDLVAPAPSTNLTENKLKNIWCELLAISLIDREDDFFESGGNSLSAIDLMNRINQQFQTELSISWLFKNNTLQKQISALAQGENNDYQPLISFNTQGTKPPLFLIHPAHAGAETYLSWQSLVDPNQPCHLIQSYNLHQKENFLTTIPAMASHYVKHLLKTGHTDPFYLGGWSLGGLIAYEMAHQLQMAGHEVAKVFLMDSFTFNAEHRLFLQKNKTLMIEALEKSDFYLLQSTEKQQQLKKVYDIELTALTHYQPPVFTGETLLFKATQPNPTLPILMPDNGWQQYATHLRIEPIAADHDHIIKPPYLQQIIDCLQQQIKHGQILV